MNHFSIGLWYVTKSEFCTTTCNDQLSCWTYKKLQSTSQSQICTKKGHCLVVCCWSDSLQLPESWRSHYIWEVCSANQWDALKTATLAAALVNRKGPVLLQDNAWPHVTQPVLQKLRELSYGVLPHPPYSPDLLPTEYHLFKSLENLLQEKHIHNQQETENAFQEFIESWSTYFYATGISKLISCWQNVLIVSSVQSLSLVRLFATTWTAACQAAVHVHVHHQLPEFT